MEARLERGCLERFQWLLDERFFSEAIGHTTNLVAEMWGFRDGHELAVSFNIRWLEVEVDSTDVIEHATNANKYTHDLSSLVSDYRALLTKFQQISFKHTHGGGNRCADDLAEMESLSVVFFCKL